METRRQAREWVVQVLFTLDFNKDGIENVLGEFWKEHNAARKTVEFVERYVRGIVARRDELDGMLGQSASNWNINRMGGIERNVMRMSIYEMMYCPDVPPDVSINEAVDIAKYFSNVESGRFVNGILDQIRKRILERPTEAP